MIAPAPIVAVLATLNTKGKEASFVADVLAHAGAKAWIVDLSLKPHELGGAHVTGANVACAGGATWQRLSECSRQDAAAIMAEGGKKILLEKFLPASFPAPSGLAGRTAPTSYARSCAPCLTWCRKSW